MFLTIKEHDARIARFHAEYERTRALHTLLHSRTESARAQEYAAFDEMMAAHERWLDAIQARMGAAEARFAPMPDKPPPPYAIHYGRNCYIEIDHIPLENGRVLKAIQPYRVPYFEDESRGRYVVQHRNLGSTINAGSSLALLAQNVMTTYRTCWGEYVQARDAALTPSAQEIWRHLTDSFIEMDEP